MNIIRSTLLTQSAAMASRGRGSVSKYRKKLNLGLTAGPVDHVVVPPIDGFHADAVLAQRDDHHSLGEIPSGPRAIVPEPHTNILRPRLGPGVLPAGRLAAAVYSRALDLVKLDDKLHTNISRNILPRSRRREQPRALVRPRPLRAHQRRETSIKIREGVRRRPQAHAVPIRIDEGQVGQSAEEDAQ